MAQLWLSIRSTKIKMALTIGTLEKSLNFYMAMENGLAATLLIRQYLKFLYLIGISNEILFS